MPGSAAIGRIVFSMMVAGAAVAQDNRREPAEPTGELRDSTLFEMWDRDGDGYLHREEVGDAKLFDEWNRDRDDRLSREEFIEGLAGNGGQ